MTSDFMKELLSKDEKITVEYKTCQYGIQEDVYETVCSFSNRYGGYIIMGVEDDGTPIGINPNMVKDMKKNFVNQLNNSDKMSPTLYLSIEDIVYEGMTLLWVYVPPTSTVEKCANRIYDRNEDGDMDITDSPIQLQNMYNRKSNTYAEHKIFPYVTMEDLRMDLMDKVRNLAKSKNPDHPWLKMSDEEILKSAGLWEKDFSSGIQGYNLAGVLLFGKQEIYCPIDDKIEIEIIKICNNLKKSDFYKFGQKILCNLLLKYGFKLNLLVNLKKADVNDIDGIITIRNKGIYTRINRVLTERKVQLWRYQQI